MPASPKQYFVSNNPKNSSMINSINFHSHRRNVSTRAASSSQTNNKKINSLVQLQRFEPLESPLKMVKSSLKYFRLSYWNPEVGCNYSTRKFRLEVLHTVNDALGHIWIISAANLYRRRCKNRESINAPMISYNKKAADSC